jgi:hypothetical protein
MGPLEAHSAIVSLLGGEPFAARVAAARAGFQARTGAFGPEDAWFEARSRAFWDDATTRGGLAALACATPEAAETTTGVGAWVGPFARAHRGLFVVAEREDEETVLHCLLTGVDLFVDDLEPGTRDALAAASAPFDGRVVAAGTPIRCALLPGAVFHPEDAKEPILKVLAAAREKKLSPETTLDALLRMELSLRSLSRVKASYAYRPEALRARDP